jgi:hypothetical protein
MTTRPLPFQLAVPERSIEDLQARLGLTRFPDQAPGPGWTYGTDVNYMRELATYWRDKFDWRQEEARLNSLPNFKVPLAGIDLHFIHVDGHGPNPMPLLLSHGWPGSVFEFLDLIPRLTDPARFGGDPADAFTIVAPSLLGYGLSFTPGQKRLAVEGPESPDEHSRRRALRGRACLLAQGGDGLPINPGHTSPDTHFWRADSPVGLAAWIVEKPERGPTPGGARRASDRDSSGGTVRKLCS